MGSSQFRETFQLIHEHSKCFFLLHFNQLCVEVYDNTCDDRNDKNSVNREQDGTDLSNQCDGNNVAKSGGRDDGVTIPQRITIAVDIRFDKPVPAAIRELEKIELIRQSDRGYRIDYAVTATQKEILKAFNMTAANIRTQAAAMNEDLMQIEKEG